MGVLSKYRSTWRSIISIIILLVLVSFEPDSTKTEKDQKEWDILEDMEQKYSKKDYEKQNKKLLEQLNELDSIIQDTSGQIKTGNKPKYKFINTQNGNKNGNYY